MFADEAVEARSYTAMCLRLFASMAHESPHPKVREECQRKLEQWLVWLRELIAAPDAPDALKADARRALLGFWQA